MYQLFICLSIRDRVRDDLAEPPCRGPFPLACLVAACFIRSSSWCDGFVKSLILREGTSFLHDACARAVLLSKHSWISTCQVPKHSEETWCRLHSCVQEHALHTTLLELVYYHWLIWFFIIYTICISTSVFWGTSTTSIMRLKTRLNQLRVYLIVHLIK